MFEKFTVMDLIRTRSDAVCTVSGNTLKFNLQTARELAYPSYIQFLINPKDKQFAIRACKADAPSAISFSKPAEQQKYPIKVVCATITDSLRKLMGWSMDQSWNLPGIFFAEENGIMFDLTTAFAPSPKGGWAVKREKEAAAATALASVSANDIVE